MQVWTHTFRLIVPVNTGTGSSAPMRAKLRIPDAGSDSAGGAS